MSNIAANANNNANLNTDLATIFSAIESSANCHLSELDIKGLFADLIPPVTRHFQSYGKLKAATIEKDKCRLSNLVQSLSI